ncbi:NTP transferase domain-containing protein [Sandarakinorhabdus sp. DWP1-3-1]|uniref:phosphocholine cytidylyltransferase family protein n=1 Tax=Sandarakinorhabdus sp. DWP1-3-1 TaxID=2804627 RepID=UPI003CE8F8DC
MQAIILAAGMGTRLRSVSPSKPLTMVAGRPLIHRILDNLAAAGITRPLVVTGYRGDDVAEAVHAWGAETLHNAEWAQPNGVSVLAAAPRLEAEALLVMADHLASPGVYAAVAGAGCPDAGLVLGIDRRMGHPWADEADVTRVATRQGRIVAIGKQICTYDAHDCGVFLITPELVAALAPLPAPGLSDGVRALAARGRALTVDVSAHDWIDIDDPRALALAEDWVQ